MNFPIIDYKSHPAFVNFKVDPDDYSLLLLPVFKELDVIVNEFDAKQGKYDEIAIEKFYKSIIYPFIDQNLIAFISENYNFNSVSKLVMHNSLASFIQKIHDQSIYKNLKKSYKIKGLSIKAKRVLEELNGKGISTGMVDSNIIDEINQCIEPYKNAVINAEKNNPGGRNFIDIPKRSRHWQLVMQSLKESGFLDGASAFYGSNLIVSGCGLELSTDKQTWWRDCYSDIGLETVPCTYMHNDYDYDYVKSLLYLSEVEESTGPFSYIPESHKWQREQSVSFYIKEVEKHLNNYFKDKNLGKSQYYRRAMGIKEGREAFYALPTLFQQLSHFGDDIMPNTKLSEELLSKEVKITSDQGNFAFFTGGTGIHRGSNVEKGQRWALQITLTKEPKLKKKITNSTRNILASFTKSIIGENKMLELQKKYKSTF